MAHCEAALRQLWLPEHYSDYGWNENDATHMVQTSMRGQSSGLLLLPYPLLDQSQVLNHTFMPPMADDRKFEREVHDSKENLQFTTDLEINQPREGPEKFLGIIIVHDSIPLCSAAGPSCPIPVNAALSNYEQELQPVKHSDKLSATTAMNEHVSSHSMAGSWLRKQFNLECNLESVLHPGLYVISPGDYGSRSSSTWIDHRTSSLPHFGTVVISPIRHASYGLFNSLIIITQDVLRLPTDGPGSLYLTRVPQLYLCPEEAIQCLIRHLKKSLCMEHGVAHISAMEYLRSISS